MTYDFAQLLEHAPHHHFRRCVERYRGNRGLRRFRCWDQFLCMVFAQLTFRESLRDIEASLGTVPDRLYHMGIRSAVSRSTLADANEKRNWRAPSGATSPTPVEWPGFRTTANHSMGETQAITKNWMGSLLEGQRDAGGQMYMRNRYYDPATSQFTQTDPIGIAGGLNTYGFAAGDPVSYADPYGLAADTSFFGAQNGDEARALWSELRTQAQAATESGDVTRAAAGFAMLGVMSDIEQSSVMFEINANDYSDVWESGIPGVQPGTGGGQERCLGNFCQIHIDSNPTGQYSNVRLTVKLAHEATGSLMGLRGINHFSDFGAVAGENLARAINGCARRESHNSAVPAC